ncbi:MAG: alkyl sulfatase dimerization domain-containing protein [Candidatus Puniceispirillaceae bacterium]
MKAHHALVAQADQTKKDIIALGSGIYTAVGYAASNVHMIEGKDTVTIIDTTETTSAATNILAEFRKLTDKPIARIIYTHSHRDHISGAAIFSEGQEIPILASHLFKSDLVDVDPDLIFANKALMRRTFMQFGIGLSDDERISLGVGPGDRPMQGMGAGHITPNEIIHHDCDIDLDGITARLIHAPGETDDHLIVWLPEQKILFSGDNWYHAFPNLYAIRGTAYRDFQKWADSLSLMADLEPEILAPGHTRVVFGKNEVHEVLTSTRDAILHVMRETAKGMDEGLSLDDICATITLPEPLASKPWLQEFYGKVDWSARAFATGILGWYDGNPTNLSTISTKERAAEMVALAGGIDALLTAARDAQNPRWGLELCDHLLVLGQDAALLKADKLEALAETEINATARNSYIWAANELRKKYE